VADTGRGRGLADRGAEQRVAERASRKQLAGAGGEKRLDDRGLADSAASDVQEPADQGAERGLADRGAERPVIAILKSGPDWAYEDNDGTLSIAVRNIGTDVIERLVLVDCVTAKLEVTGAAEAVVTSRLDDRSTVIAWDLREPLAPGQTRSVQIGFHVPRRAP
jgi:hypothetical protein